MEQDLRKKTISLYLKGATPKSIYSELNRSKNWFFKWLKRYQTGEPDWYKDKSRAPQKQPAALSEIDRQRIISVRTRLDSQKFGQIGVSAIKWELSKSGFRFPSDRTINWVQKKKDWLKKTSYIPKGVEYPYFKEPLDYNNIHQADLVGPRYIK